MQEQRRAARPLWERALTNRRAPLYAARVFRASRGGGTLRKNLPTSIFVAAFAVCSSLFGAEDWNGFLSALKSRGYDDVALVYLQQLQSSGEAPPELDAELGYKIGVAAQEEGEKSSGARREELMDQALAAYEKYLAESSTGTSRGDAQARSGRILAERGDRLLADSSRSGLTESEAEGKRLSARSAYFDATQRFSAALEDARSRAKELQASATGNPRALTEAQAQFLDLTLRLATTEAQRARTWPADSTERTEGLTRARSAFEEIATKYGSYAGSFRARYGEAEIARELGDLEGALKILSELAVLPYEEGFYALKTRSLLLYAEIATDQGTPRLLMDLVRKFNAWTSAENAPTAYYESAEGRKIHLLAGRATLALEGLRRSDYDAYVNAAKRVFVDKEDPTYKLFNVPKSKKSGLNPLLTFAIKTLSKVASGRDALALEAKKVLEESELLEGVDLSQFSFSAKADDFASAVNLATLEIANFSRAHSAATNAAPDAKEEAERERDLAAAAAFDALRLAYDLSARELRPDRKGKLSPDAVEETTRELDKLRMKHVALAYATGRYEEAFALGESLARRPTSEEGARGAAAALRALQALASESRARGDDESAVEALNRRALEFSSFIEREWGDAEDSQASQEASYARLDAAIANGNAEEAREILAKIPTNSGRRANAELKFGRALWNEWTRRRESRSLDEEEDGSSAAELDALLAEARKTLRDGLERKLTAGVADDDALAVYSTNLLAQTCAQTGDYTEAEKWLTHPRIGALTIVERALAGEELPEAFSFVNDVFQMSTLALKLRIATQDAERLEEAQKTMDELESIASRSPENASKLTATYLTVGKRFEERVRDLKKGADAGDATKSEELAKTTAGFKMFLESASNRQDGNSFASTIWIGDSFLALGSGLTDGKSAPRDEAREYLEKARATYMSAARRCKEEPSFATSENSLFTALLKTCECDRRTWKFKEAYAGVCKLLEKSPDNLDAQREAAQVLHEWGRVDPQHYAQAIVGDVATSGGKKLVWGWNGIIKRLAPSIDKNERAKELYFEAQMSKARSRYLYLRSLKDKDEIARQARSAEEDLRRLRQTRPTLGGAKSSAYLDAAYQNFQKLRGVREPASLIGKK